MMEIDIEEESVTVEIPERDFRMKLSGSLPEGSMKWVVLGNWVRFACRAS